MLVTAATASVEALVGELREIGVNAHGLDVIDSERGGSYLLRKGAAPDDDPTLLVATLSTVRGLDLPDLSHVFVLGASDGVDHDAYVHAAGRVGRFGRSGKVIAILRRFYVAKQHGKRSVVDEPIRMKAIYQKLGVTPVNVEHFASVAPHPKKPKHVVEVVAEEIKMPDVILDEDDIRFAQDDEPGVLNPRFGLGSSD